MGNETDDTLMDLYVKAAGWVALMPPFANEEETGKAIDIVALAISKAIEETHEECAMLAYNTPHYTIGAGFGDLDGRGQLRPGSPYDAGRYDAAQAIRSRSKGEE